MPINASPEYYKAEKLYLQAQTTEETIKAMDRDFVFDYFKKAYSPENYIVTVVGDADFDGVCKYFEEKFEKRGKWATVKKIVKKNGDIVEERVGIDQANFILAMHAPLVGEKRYDVLEVLNAYLASGMSSKLFLNIREEKGLAYVVRGYVHSEKNYSYYMIYVGTTRKAVPEVKKIILEEFKKIEEMTEKDLEEAKERIIGLGHVAKEDSSSVMNELMYAEIVNKAEDYYGHDSKIKKVKLEDVKKLAKDLIRKYSTAVVMPK